MQTIADRGITPWCFGIEAQRSTGWAATDWVEDLIIRQWGTEVYDGWVDGTVPFSDPRIAASFAYFRELALNPRLVAGGTPSVLRTPVETANAPLFSAEPGCVLYHAPSFAAGWMPSGTTVGADGSVDFFVLPPASVTEGPAPLVVGTDLAVSFDPRPEVQAVMAYLASPDAVRTWTREGGFLSPSDGIDVTSYSEQTQRVLAQALSGETVLAVDGSDAMPPLIGSDQFWTQITAWIGSNVTYDEMAATLDAARPPPGSSSAGSLPPPDAP